MLCATVIDESKKSLHINKLEGFNSYHNFRYNNHGVRVWKCYEMGRGKVYDYDDIYVEHQAPTMMQAQEPNLGFRDPLLRKRILKAKTQEASKKDDCKVVVLFECSVSGCTKAFYSFSIQLHQDIGNHTKSSQYDIIRRDWAKKFRTVDSFSAEKAAPSQMCLVQLAMPEREAAQMKGGMDIECIEEHADRQELLDLVNNEIKFAHPIYYDVYDLCECYRTDTLSKFRKTILKSICLHFEIPFRSADLKKTLVAKIAETVSQCECVAN